MSGADEAVRVHRRADGTAIELRVAAGARQTRIVGRHDGRLKVQVQAPPEAGKANRAVCALLATTLGVARRDVEVEAGATSRDKLVRVRGLGPNEIVRRLG